MVIRVCLGTEYFYLIFLAKRSLGDYCCMMLPNLLPSFMVVWCSMWHEVFLCVASSESKVMKSDYFVEADFPSAFAFRIAWFGLFLISTQRRQRCSLCSVCIWLHRTFSHHRNMIYLIGHDRSITFLVNIVQSTIFWWYVIHSHSFLSLKLVLKDV